MTPELTALALAILLQGLQLLLMAVTANLELGPRTTMSPRDDGPLTDKASVLVGRLSRALDNH
ncbi:MAG: MAPEG family protein, partial [Mangrovicoccus sp.]|nr:MAPEG family protein [Mangrovicoccus sp.]